MTLLPWLHFVHVLAAIVWLGGGILLMLASMYVRSSTDPKALTFFARMLSYVGLRGLTPAVVVLLVTGVWMILDGSGWTFSQFWVQLALALFAVAFLIGAVYMSRVGLQMESTARAGALEGATGQSLVTRWQLGYSIVLVVLLAALWDMVFKPGL
jgi:uncharacterized membrane protein